jgi:hypothetical protein
MKNHGFKMLILIIAIIGSMQLVSCSKDTSDDYVAAEDETAALVEKSSSSGSNASWLGGCISSLPLEDLSAEEIEALTFMREEELLAKDVYVLFSSLYNIPIFTNISLSETQHALAVKRLLLRYNLPDPAENHVAGEFENQDLTTLYTSLTTLGSTSLVDALFVGATIEDMDINDLHTHIATDIDNLDILYVFGNLEKGSRNHMRSFYKHLKAKEVIYEPQYISQEYFDAIISSPHEAGRNVCPE